MYGFWGTTHHVSAVAELLFAIIVDLSSVVVRLISLYYCIINFLHYLNTQSVYKFYFCAFFCEIFVANLGFKLQMSALLFSQKNLNVQCDSSTIPHGRTKESQKLVLH